MYLILFRHKLDHDEHPVSGVLSLIPDGIKFHRKITPLCLAAQNKILIGNVRTLIDHGAHVNAEYRYDIAPLVMALEAGYLDMCLLLISNGARVNIYHPQVIGNLAVIAGMQHWKGLMLVLTCNAEVRTLFTSYPSPWILPRMPSYVSKYGFVNPKDNCSDQEGTENDSDNSESESNSENLESDTENPGATPFFEIMSIAKLNARRLHIRAPICKFFNVLYLLKNVDRSDSSMY